MAVYTMIRFELRPDALVDAERAMHAFATFVRAELPASTWTAYRDPHAPTRYVAIVRDEDRAAVARRRDAAGSHAFDAALRPWLVGEPEATECELVTSSDLAPRHRTPPGRRRSR